MLAAILTIGNEVVSGDTENTNASWLSRRLEELGVNVVISAAIPDELDRIVGFVRREAPLVDHLIVTGGLGGTPDDITRATRTTPRAGLRCRRGRARSRTRSAARRGSSSRTPGSCRGCRAR